MKPHHLAIVLAALFGGCSPSDEKSGSASTSDLREPDPLIVSKLQEIVKLRERQAKEAQLLVEMGQGANDGAVEVALAEARIALAREQGQSDAVVDELRNLVKVLEKRFKREEALFDEDRRTQANIGQLRVALLEAEVRLQRELIALKRGEPKTLESSENAFK